MSVIALHASTVIWFSMACEGFHNFEDSYTRINSSNPLSLHDLNCKEHSWINNPYMPIEVDKSDLTGAYVLSFYWAVASVTSTGYGDVTASTSAEKAVSIMIIFSGTVVFFGLILGGLTSILTNMDTRRTDYYNRLVVIKSHLLDIGVAKELLARVVNFYEYVWHVKHGVLGDSSTVYDSLPISFQAEISHDVSACILNKAPIFKGVNEGFLRVLSLKINHEIYMPNQIILKRGEVGNEMFFIRKGTVEVLSEDDDETPIATLKTGMVFGETNMILSMPRSATVRAATYCDLLVLKKQDFKSVISHYPEVNDAISAQVKGRYDAAHANEKVILEDSKRMADPQYRALKPRTETFVKPSRYRRSSFTPQAQRHHTNLSSRGAKSYKPMTITENVEILRSEDNDMTDIHNLLQRHKAFDKQLSEGIYEAISTGYGRGAEVVVETLKPVWTYIMVVVHLLVATLFPYVACFTYADYLIPGYDSSLPSGKFWLSVTYLLDVFLLIDFIVKLQKDLRNIHKKPNKKMLYLKYLRQAKFLQMVISVLPLELLSFIRPLARDRWHLFAFLRLNRVLYFISLMDFLTKTEDNLNISLGLLRSFKIGTYMFLLLHWVACLLFLFHCQGENCTKSTWYTAWVSSLQQPVPMTNITAHYRYLVSVYWAAASMTSTGYGDISARSIVSMIISALAQIAGLLLFGWSIGLMAATLTNLDSARVNFQARLFAVKNFMTEQHLGTDLQPRVIHYLCLMWTKYKGVWMPGEPDLLKDCPQSLKVDMALEEAYKTLANTPLFRKTDDIFLRNIAMKCRIFYFCPGDFIMIAGETGLEFFYIRRGYAEVYPMDMSEKIGDLLPGSYFGEQGFLFGDKNQMTVKATTYAEILVLSAEDFQEVLVEFPIHAEHFEQVRENKAHYLRLQAELFKTHGIDLQEKSSTSLQRKSSLSQKRKSERRVSAVEATMVQEEAKKEAGPASIVSFKFGVQKRLYEQYISKMGWKGNLAKIFLCRFALLPEGKLLKNWTYMVVLLTFIMSLSLPIQMSFYYTSAFLWVIHYIFDIIFFINIYLNLHVGYYNQDAVLTTHPLCTATNYMKTSFILDLLATFPFEFFVAAAYGNINGDIAHVLALARINRFLHVIKIPLAFNYFEDSIKIDTGFIRKIKFAIYMIVFTNLTGCVLYLTACPPALIGNMDHKSTIAVGHRCYKESWVLFYKLENASINQLYVRSVYSGTETIVSVGYGDMVAKTQTEMLVSVVFMIVGVMLFGYIIASVTAALANADAGRARFQEKLNGITLLMTDHNVNVALRKRVLKYYNYLWLRTKGVNPTTLFDGLPNALLGEVTYRLYNKAISKISLFTHTDKSFIKMLSRCMKPLYFLNGEYVVRKHDVGQEMFFIHRGEVEVCNAEGTMVFDTMKQGAAFGEVALLFSCPRTASIRAKVNSDVFCLNKTDLDKVLEMYPTIKTHVLNIGKERRQQARKRSATKINIGNKEEEEEVKKGPLEVKAPPVRRLTKHNIYSKVQAPQKLADGLEKKKPSLTLLEVDEEENENQSNNDTLENKNTSNRCCLSDTDSVQLTDTEQQTTDEEEKDPVYIEYDDYGNVNQSNINANQNNNEKKGVESEAELGRCKKLWNTIKQKMTSTIRPDGKHYRRFLGIIQIFGAFQAWLTIYQMGFHDFHPALIALAYICDLVNLIELIIQPRVSFYDDYGQLVEDKDVIRSTYLKNPLGFAKDLACVLPIEVLCLAAPTHIRMNVWACLRILRLLRLYHFIAYFNEWEKELNVNMLVVRILKFSFLTLWLVHFIGCVWYMLDCPLSSCTPRPDSWINNVRFAEDTISELYWDSVYWAVATMTSAGYGDIYAHNNDEMVYAVLVMILGKLVFGFVLGNIASTLANNEARMTLYRNLLTAIQSKMKDQDVPGTMRRRVNSYLDYVWVRNKGHRLESLFDDAPQCLVAEVFYGIAKSFFESINLFKGTEEAFLRQMSLSVHRILYQDGDYIARKDEIGADVMYVFRGRVSILAHNEEEEECEVKVLGPGQVLGEVFLVKQVPRCMSIRAKEKTDILMITQVDCQHMLELYPPSHEMFLSNSLNVDSDW